MHYALEIAILILLIHVSRKINRPHGRQPKGDLKIMYIVKDDNPPVGYTLTVGDVTDAEGNAIPDAQLSVEVVSDNPASVAVTSDADAKTGSISFGSPGDAAITASVKSGDKVLGVVGAQFHVTTGDPAAISGGSIAFEGLTEAPA